MDFKISIALHIIGIVMWIGGLMILTRFMKLGTESGQVTPALSAMIKRIYFGYVLGGCVLAVLTGLYQVISRGFQFYLSQGWFHGKLTLVILALIVTVIVGTLVKAIEAGRVVSRGKVGAMHGLTGLVLLLVVFATILGRAG